MATFYHLVPPWSRSIIPEQDIFRTSKADETKIITSDTYRHCRPIIVRSPSLVNLLTPEPNPEVIACSRITTLQESKIVNFKKNFRRNQKLQFSRPERKQRSTRTHTTRYTESAVEVIEYQHNHTKTDQKNISAGEKDWMRKRGNLKISSVPSSPIEFLSEYTYMYTT